MGSPLIQIYYINKFVVVHSLGKSIKIKTEYLKGCSLLLTT